MSQSGLRVEHYWQSWWQIGLRLKKALLQDARISLGLSVYQIALDLYGSLGDRDRTQFCPEDTNG